MPDAPANSTLISPTIARAASRAEAVAIRPSVTGFSSVSLVIPCFNEEAGLASLKSSIVPLIERLRDDGRAVELVLVDDGSQDRTYALMLELFPSSEDVPVRIARHPENRGLSCALRSAAAIVTGDVVCTLDADCTYPPSEVLSLLQTMDRTGADVVTGSPYHPDGGVENVQGWRLALSRGASRMYGALVPEKLYCYTSMFRAYSREWFRAEFITSDHFVGVTEILIRAILSGAHVVEYPVVLRRRVYGTSKLRVGQAMWEHLKFMGRIAVTSGSRVNGAS